MRLLTIAATASVLRAGVPAEVDRCWVLTRLHDTEEPAAFAAQLLACEPR